MNKLHILVNKAHTRKVDNDKGNWFAREKRL